MQLCNCNVHVPLASRRAGAVCDVLEQWAHGTILRATRYPPQSTTLSGLGRREDALTAIEEAVKIRRGLAAARPDAFLPDLKPAVIPCETAATAPQEASQTGEFSAPRCRRLAARRFGVR
jgi:hypothetical protein